MPSALSWLRKVPPPCFRNKLSKRGTNAGAAITVTTKAVHTEAVPSEVPQPANNAIMLDGAVRLRRRLSSIFQRPVTGTEVRFFPPGPKIQGKSCQSPRAHR